MQGGQPLQKYLTGARCWKGQLWIDQPSWFDADYLVQPSWHLAVFPGLNYHSYDYNLFYWSIRTNAKQRVIAFFQSQEIGNYTKDKH